MRDAGTADPAVRMTLAGNGDDLPALEFAGLVKRFGDEVAVDHIDLTVPAGSFFGLVRPNGPGKTTSLSMAAALLCWRSVPAGGRAGGELRAGDLRRVRVPAS
jgi:ATPase subunit of ABC transporter with duplicated ATPase domains